MTGAAVACAGTIPAPDPTTTPATTKAKTTKRRTNQIVSNHLCEPQSQSMSSIATSACCRTVKNLSEISSPVQDRLLATTQRRIDSLARLWHGQRRMKRTLWTKQRKPALHKLVKPYLDGLILIRDVEAGGSNPLTPTNNPLLLPGCVVAQFIAHRL